MLIQFYGRSIFGFYFKITLILDQLKMDGYRSDAHLKGSNDIELCSSILPSFWALKQHKTRLSEDTDTLFREGHFGFFFFKIPLIWLT